MDHPQPTLPTPENKESFAQGPLSVREVGCNVLTEALDHSKENVLRGRKNTPLFAGQCFLIMPPEESLAESSGPGLGAFSHVRLQPGHSVTTRIIQRPSGQDKRASHRTEGRPVARHG